MILLALIAYILVIRLVLRDLVWRFTGRLQTYPRLLVRTFFVALLVTPSLFGAAGEGGAAVLPLPVVFVFIISIVGHDWAYLLYGGVIPVACGWVVALIISLLYQRFWKRKNSRVA